MDFFFPFFLHPPSPSPDVAQAMMVFGVALPSQITKRTDQFQLAGEIHQRAIDFINCSGESLAGHLVLKCAAGTQAGAVA